MMQKHWFKVFIWVVSTAFFFLASAIVISEFSPQPTQDQTMRFMMGMMDSMDQSMMGLSMSLESNNNLISLIKKSTDMTIPLVSLSAIFAIVMRVWGKKNA